MFTIDDIFKYILEYEYSWCEKMKFFNPYLDPFDTFISNEIPNFDNPAFFKYTKHNFVYDKLWVVKSQGLMGGTLNTLKPNKNINLPIFIKPRWGHETATSKNCFKIKEWEEIEQYRNIPDMMWSEFIDAKEQMTDYILLDGKIVYQITYVYSDTQNEYIDDWKYISPKNKPLQKITDWVNRHMVGFTGAVNMQYRSDKIIEVGLRLARGGAYILSTKNKYLIQNINNVVDKNFWDYSIQNKCNFKPFYSFKCYTSIPIFYVFPQYYLDYMMKKYNAMPFYEYYFEPAGKSGMVFLQFLHEDYEVGSRAKKHIERLIFLAQVLFVFLLIVNLVLFNYNKKIGIIFLIIILCFFNTRFLNPINVQHGQWKAVKQMIFS